MSSVIGGAFAETGNTGGRISWGRSIECIEFEVVVRHPRA